MKYKKIIIPVIVIVLGVIYFSSGGSEKNTIEISKDNIESNELWTCSMHPQIKAEEQGNCPICGMTLIPLKRNKAEGSTTAVKMTKEAVATAGIETVEVSSEVRNSQIEIYGKVNINDDKTSVQVSHFPGRLDLFYIKTEGEYVNKGDAIAKIYSPILVQAQKELLEANKVKDSQIELYNASIEKLKQWNLRDNQIESIIKNNKPIEDFVILSDFTGYVWEIKSEEGAYVKEGTPLFKIANLNTVWIDFDIYEKDLPAVKLGTTIKFKIEGLSGSIFEGKTIFVSPTVNARTRVATARVLFVNNKDILKPGQYAWGKILVSSGKMNKIIVPKSAILWTGKRSVVYVQVPNIDEPQYELRQITLGRKIGDNYVIEDGLEIGENIVKYGAFTVDATAQLEGKPSMLQPTGARKIEDKKIDMDMDLNVSEEFRVKLTELTKSYMIMKDAFVKSGKIDIYKSIILTQKSLNNISMKSLKNDEMMKWHPIHNKLKGFLDEIKTIDDLKKQRQVFEQISDELVAAIKLFGISDKVYLFYCPMFGGDGANWLSASRDVENPYFGQSMLKCGSLKNTL